MSEIEQKARAFDKIHAELRESRRRTNIDAWREVLDRVLRKFDWELILIAERHLCQVCGVRLNINVINWSHSKGIRWVCPDCYHAVRETGLDKTKYPLMIRYHRSFRLMVAKKGVDGY